MEYPVEEMNYKMKFINDKLENGEELSSEEKEYMKKMESFKKFYDLMCLEYQLKNVEIDKEAILELLAKKRKELVKIIKGTKSKNKLPQLHNQVKNIDEFIQSDAVEYFKDLLIDNNSIRRVNAGDIFSELSWNDPYLAKPYLANDNVVGLHGSPFMQRNHYLDTVKFNRPLIDLVRHILMNDYSLYHALEEGKETLADGTLIPEEYRKLNLKAISAIIYYGRGRIGNMEDHTFDTFKDDLDILVAMDQVQKGDITKVDDTPIKDSIRDILMGIISGKYKVKDFNNYQILRYCDPGFDTTKFRKILREHRFNLDSVQRKLLEDDLLRTTKLNGGGNLFVDENENLQLANISLASAVMNGEPINDDECLSADPDCLNRIRYYNPANRNNPHDYEIDKYDSKALLAIARYKEELKKQLEQEETMGTKAVG